VQPAPTVSGKYISGERPLEWTHEMPLADGETSSKAGEVFAVSKPPLSAQ